MSTFAESVLSLVPAGFATYVRVFHPVRLGPVTTTWAEIARANGKRVHPGMQIHSIGTPDSAALNATGHVDLEVAQSLVSTLTRHTRTPDSCSFAIWEGLGRLPASARAAPSFTLPNRRYHLLTGPVAAAVGDVYDRPFGYQSPNIWWPDDRAWCVTTEIDLHSTYIGCSADCAADLLANTGIESLTVLPTTGITFDSDTFN